MKRFLLVSLVCGIAGCAGSQHEVIGARNGDTMVFTSRESWEADLRKESVDGTAYRLGTDIVLFVGSLAGGRPDMLEMTPASGFSQPELQRMRSSTERRDIPTRDDSMLDALDISRGWQAENQFSEPGADAPRR
jgi:hypothetical protein